MQKSIFILEKLLLVATIAIVAKPIIEQVLTILKKLSNGETLETPQSVHGQVNTGADTKGAAGSK